MRKTIKQIVVGANLFFVFLITLSYLAQIIKPLHLAFLQIVGLGHLYLLIVNLGFVTFWLIKGSRWAFLSLFFILIGFDNLQSTFQFNFAETQENSIKLLSYNVRAFDRYNWSNTNHAKQKMFDFIQDEQPQIICYQEFFSRQKDGLSTFDTLLLLQKAKNHHLAYYKVPKKLNLTGVAIFSTFPIVKKGKIEYNGNIFSIFTDLKINNDTLRVYNCHLQSVHFGEDNYNFIDSIEEADQKKVYKGVKNIYGKLISAYEKRLAQAQLLKEHTNSCPHQIILTGDFNDGSNSYVYNFLKENLFDTFEDKAKGFGFSYVRGILKFRIDFIFRSQNIYSLNFETRKYNYSDHYPLIYQFSL